MTGAKLRVMAPQLEDYRRKRDFVRTPEPRGDMRDRQGAQDPRFVVQRHDARRLHFDFRLEVGGVLKSWAVPKGPSLDPGIRRLAVATEDHPLEYADFEGVIGEGQYGAGTVIVWDTGTYRNLTEDNGTEVSVERAIEQGHVVIWLEGKKLRGGFALHHWRGNYWLLVKMRDEWADPGQDPVRSQPESVLTGRTNEDYEPQVPRRSAKRR